MGNFDFNVNLDTTVEVTDRRDRRYERALALTGFAWVPPERFDRADVMFCSLRRKQENRVNPFALAVSELGLVIESDDAMRSTLSTDTPRTAPSCALVVEALVTGLRTSGAPSATPSAHLGSGAAAA